MIGTIATIELEGTNTGEDRANLFRSGILGFERLALRQFTDDLEQMTSMNAVDLLPLFATQDNYESALYADILRSRLQAVTQLRNLSSDNEKEKVLQEHLFKHLWLLDASWERATGSEQMEQDLRRVAPGLFAADKNGNPITGRIDIRYASAGGRHLIFELKRYSVKVDIDVLAEQGNKYAVALRDLLVKQGTPQPDIEVIFVLGEHPTAKSAGLMVADEYIAQRLETCRGRIVFYDTLIKNAENQYSEYLDASTAAKALDDLLSSLTPQTAAPRPAAASATGQPAPKGSSPSPGTAATRASTRKKTVRRKGSR